jgi:CRISPR-associated protein Csy1
MNPGTEARQAIEAGKAAMARRDRRAALIAFERAAELDPGSVQALNLAADLHLSMGNPGAAVTLLRRSVGMDHRQKGAWNNLGTALMMQGQTGEAADCFRKALKIDPRFAWALTNYGRYLLFSGEAEKARHCLERAIREEPGLVDAHLNLGNAHRLRRDPQRAEQALRRALELSPNHLNAWLLLADTCADTGQTEEALKCYGKAAAIRPQSLHAALGQSLVLPRVYSSPQAVATARKRFSKGIEQLHQRTEEFLALSPQEKLNGIEWTNFLLAYQGGNDLALQQRFSAFQRDILRSVIADGEQPMKQEPVAGRRLKVGFVSGFLNRSTVGRYFSQWITGLDSSRFESLVFSLNTRSDELTREIEETCDTFRDGFLSLPELAGAIRDARPDVLIYPELGMNPRCFALANLRLAPLQCAAWGHPVTTGHDNVDVFFSVEGMEPEDGETHYSERLLQLPGIGTCYPRPEPPALRSRRSLGLPEDRILYLFPQSLFKIHPDNDDLLGRILAAEPRAQLVLIRDRHPGLTRKLAERLAAALQRHGVDASARLTWLDRLSHDDYLAVNLACDVMLDSLHWSGGNTALDAFACCLPLVTLPGRRMRGRQSLAMLKILGLEEWAASSPQDYVDKALALGREDHLQARVRQHLADHQQLLFDQDEPIKALQEHLLSLTRHPR